MKDCRCKDPKKTPARNFFRPGGAVNPPRITVQSARPDLGTEYATFIYKPDRLEILYMKGGLVQSQVMLTYRDSECVFFADCPDARQVYNGMGWNLKELSAWSHLVSEDREFLAEVKS